MRLTLTDENGNIKVVDVSADLSVNDFKALAEVELQIPASGMRILHNGRDLQASATLQGSGVVQDDMLLVLRTGPPQQQDQAEAIRTQLLNDPATLQRVAAQNPALAAAINNPAEFRRALEAVNRRQREAEAARRAEEAALHNADPFDLEAQRKIEEQIRKDNILRNLETAMENHPEAFGRVIMLYIDMEVNGVPVKAFVDSGAQATIMSPDCAEKCKIMHLLDERFAGIAQGVGTAKILGRVHSAQIKLGTQFLACSFTIMEGKGVDLLFGLDQLKRYQACIDLEKNCLRINGEEIRFLNEHELPDQARENHASAPEDSAGASSAIAASSSNQSRPAVAPSAASAPKYPESVVKGLMDLGVSRDEAIRALDMAGGNAEMAANYLF